MPIRQESLVRKTGS